MPFSWQPLFLSLQLALWVTLILLLLGLPLAHWLNQSRCRLVPLLEVLLSLPLVLPPTVLGFYLLILWAPDTPMGKLWIDVFGQSLPFSFTGMVAASVVYSLPFAVQPFQAALRQVNPHLLEAAYAVGANGWQTFLHIRLREARHGIYAGLVLGFAHALGEFGLVLLIGGNIPGQTRVASIALYDEIQQINYAAAHTYAAALLVVAFILLVLLAWFRRRGAGSGF